MNLEVTSCKNCIFKIIDYQDTTYICILDKTEILNLNEFNPEYCPLNNNPLTIRLLNDSLY